MFIYFVTIFFLLISVVYSLDFTTIEKYNVPEVDFELLYSYDKETVSTLMNSLFTEGIISISNIPNFKESKDLALDNLSDCLLKNYLSFNKNDDDEHPFYTEMHDNSVRLSLGAKYLDQRPGEIKNKCGDDSKKLRELIHSTTQNLFSLFDSQIVNKSVKVMEPSFDSFTSLMREGSHLEHLHSYYGSNHDKKFGDDFIPTMDLHTDRGLLIAMTTGHFKQNTSPSDVSGLYLKLSDGRLVKAVSSDSSLLILLGEGSIDWINSSSLFSRPFRAMPHLVLNDLPAKQTDITRSWYGMMFLPPSSAIIPSSSLTFEEHNLETINSAVRGGFTRSLMDLMADVVPQTCKIDGSDGIMCWMQCYSTSNLECGQQAQCYNPETDSYNDGSTMCHYGSDNKPCYLQCPENPSNQTSSNSFCYGTGTSMFMDGFHALGLEESGSTACVNLLFTDWTLDNKSKFAVACIFTFVFGLLVQYIARLRLVVIATPKYINKPTSVDNHVSNFIYSLKVKFGDSLCLIIQRTLSVLIYGIHATFGYFAMLIAMTYNVELFCMIVLGLTLGYAFFHLDLKEQVSSTDACCPDTSHSHNFDVSPDKIISTNDNTSSLVSESTGLKKDVENCCGNYNFDD